MAAGPVFVLDAFALLALLQREAGAPRVRELISQAERGAARVMMTVVNLGEVFYRTVRTRGFEQAEGFLAAVQATAIEFVEIDEELAMAAARIKGSHPMSYADCFAAALAQESSAVVVTGDPDFHRVERRVAIEWLPESEPQ